MIVCDWCHCEIGQCQCQPLTGSELDCEPVDQSSDLNQHDPVELTAGEWREIYSQMDDYDDFMDRDCSMNG